MCQRNKHNKQSGKQDSNRTDKHVHHRQQLRMLNLKCPENYISKMSEI